MKFEAPEMKVALFEVEDVLTTSTVTEEPTNDCPARGADQEL